MWFCMNNKLVFFLSDDWSLNSAWPFWWLPVWYYQDFSWVLSAYFLFNHCEHQIFAVYSFTIVFLMCNLVCFQEPSMSRALKTVTWNLLFGQLPDPDICSVKFLSLQCGENFPWGCLAYMSHAKGRQAIQTWKFKRVKILIILITAITFCYVLAVINILIRILLMTMCTTLIMLTVNYSSPVSFLEY